MLNDVKFVYKIILSLLLIWPYLLTSLNVIRFIICHLIETWKVNRVRDRFLPEIHDGIVYFTMFL